MSITIRNIDTIVDNICNTIIKANVGITDVSNSSVVKTIVNAISSEFNMEYVMIAELYDAMKLDSASNDKLDRLISILGVFRDQATAYNGGIITFKRVIPAIVDISIPEGTEVSTQADEYGRIIKFVTTAYKYIPVGGISVDVPVKAVDTGNISVGTGSVCRMNNPIMGINSVSNASPFIGGTNKEDDKSLRARAKLALGRLGKSTMDGLKSALVDLDEVIDAVVLDQYRGVGTADVSVVCATIPPSDETKAKILSVLQSSKAAGIDCRPIYPDIKYVAISITLLLDSEVSVDTTVIKHNCADAVEAYVDSLGIGKPFIVNQLRKAILNVSEAIVDTSQTTPVENVTCTITEVIRPSSIDISIEGE